MILRPLYEIIISLEEAGHTELWMYSHLGTTCFEQHPLDQSQWYLPKIITRDGRTIAAREERPDGWLLIGDWANTTCRTGAVAPLNGIFLETDWRFNLIITR